LASNQVVIEFSRDIIQKLVCPNCGQEEEFFVPVGAFNTIADVARATATCEWCTRFSGYRGEPELTNRRLDQLGLPLFDALNCALAGRGSFATIWRATLRLFMDRSPPQLSEVRL